MARSSSRHDGSRDERSRSTVVTVSQRSSSRKEALKTNTTRDKKNHATGSMWDSFESESPSQEEEDRHQTERSGTPREHSSDAGSVKSASSTTRNEHLSRPRKKETEREDGRKRYSKKSSGTEDYSASDSRSAQSNSRRKKSSKRKIRIGDKVAVYLRLGGKAKGTVSAQSSRDRFDVTLKGGTVEKGVHSRNIALTSSRREYRGDREKSKSSSKRTKHQQKENKPKRHESQDDPVVDREESLGSTGSKSNSPSSQQRRLSGSIGVATSSPSPAAEAQPEPTAGGEKPVIQLPPAPSEAAAAASEGGSPGRQMENEQSQIPADTSPRGQASTPAEALASDSGPDTRNPEEESSPERGLSPLSSKVRQAQGLLKTMFLRKGEERGGINTEGGRRAKRRWSRGNSTTRRFSKGSDDLRDTDGSRSATPSSDDAGGGNTEEHGPSTPEYSNEAPRTPQGEATLVGPARRLKEGLTRGRSRFRKEKSEQSLEVASTSFGSSTSRSPSLVTKLGMTLRGAIMGKTELGVHRPHAGRCMSAADCSSPGAAADSDGDGTYSTGASAKEEEIHRHGERQSSTRQRSPTRSREEHCDSSNDFDSDIFDQDSPLATAAHGKGDPTNFPDAVSSYIGARERMEQEMSALGPAFLPRVDNLALLDRGVHGWGKRRGSLDITKQASSTTQRTEQHQPFTEAMFKAGISETKHSTKQGILLEGNLQKFSPESVRGVRWHMRYFVLYACSCELRYYRTHTEAAWGRIPLGERGSIPLRLVVKIEQPSDKKYRGCRFDLVVLHKGDSRHPGLHIRPGQESKVSTTKTFKFNAADAQQRLLWVTVIEALMKKHGWGLDADRSRSMRAPRHGGPDADTGDLSWRGRPQGRRGDGSGELAASNQAHNANNIRAGESPSELPIAHTTGSSRLGGVEERLLTGSHPFALEGSTLTFVEEDQQASDFTLLEENHNGHHHHPDKHDHRQQEDEESLSMLRGTTVSIPQERGLRIPYSPGGKRGSLTTGFLCPSPAPVTATGGARRQSSLRSDLRC